MRDYIYVVSIGKVYLFWYNLHELANNIYEVVTAVKDSWTVLAVDNSAVVVDEDHINAGSRFAFKMRGNMLEQNKLRIMSPRLEVGIDFSHDYFVIIVT